MTRIVMMAAMFGLAVAASACTENTPSAFLAEGQPIVMGAVPVAFGSSIPAESTPIDFQDSRTYGNYAGE